ncbi:MAG: hypothetical protein Q4B48_08825, partial [Syntrophomonadaceae bacterium]|nr:hypothetical protein [Syntrophomonadaceae bacterium]
MKRTKPRLLSILLCLCLALAMLFALSATALAADNPTYIYIAGQNLVNGDNVTYWRMSDDDKTIAEGTEADHNICYDPASNTLTLNSVTIAPDSTDELTFSTGAEAAYGIYIAGSAIGNPNSSCDLNIHLKGENSITAPTAEVYSNSLFSVGI